MTTKKEPSYTVWYEPGMGDGWKRAGNLSRLSFAEDLVEVTFSHCLHAKIVNNATRNAVAFYIYGRRQAKGKR